MGDYYYKSRERWYRRLAGNSAPPPDPWNVAWQPHNEDIQLCHVGSTRSFMIRARVDRTNSADFSQVIAAMIGILNLGASPAPPNPFAWPVLDNTWTGHPDIEED